MKNYCAEYLVRHMDASNCTTIKEVALKYNLPALRDSAMSFFDVHINNCLLESADMTDYTFAQINALFSDPRYIDAISPDVHFKSVFLLFYSCKTCSTYNSFWTAAMKQI